MAVGVAAPYRGHGIGTALVESLLDAARTAEIAAVSLSVELANPAIRIYERLGFREVGRTDDSATMLLTLA